MKIRYLITLVLLLSNLSFQASSSVEASPYLRKISRVDRILALEIGESLRFSMQTRFGNELLYIKRVANYNQESSGDDEDPELKLFRGQVITRRKGKLLRKRGIGANLIEVNGKASLRLLFPSKKESRIIRSVLKIEGVNKSSSLALSHSFGTFPHGKCAEVFLSSSARSVPRSKFSPLGAIKAKVFSPTRTIELSTDADTEWYTAYGENSNNEIQSILNDTEAIYLSQLGIQFSLKSQNVFSSSSPYTSTDGETLLNEFRDYTNSNHQLSSSDAYLLFTGKDLDDDLLGIAFVGAVCLYSNSVSYGLSQLSTPALHPLLVAHELGHLLDASHDMQEPPTLMHPQVGPTQTSFSSFSLTEITDFINQNGSCLSASESQALKLSLTQNSKAFRLSANVTSIDDMTGCNLEAYASHSKSALTTDIGSGTLILSTEINSSSLVRKKKAKTTIRDKKKAYIKGRLTCGSTTLESTTKAISTKKAILKRKVSPKAFVKYIKKRFS